VCSAIRSNETVDVLLAESPTGWGVGEYRAMAQAASQVNDWEMALRLIHRMEAAGKSHEADVAAYGYAVAACANANQPDEGRMLLVRLQRAGAAAEPRAYNQVMSAYARQRKWSDALALLGGMREAGVKPTVVSFNAALSACSAAGRWTEAIALLEKMESEVDETPRPDVISYSTVISACRKASTGTMGVSAAAALELLERMQQNNARNFVAVPTANVFTFTSAILALADAGKWEDALATYRSMPPTVERNDAIINAAVSAANVGGDWQGAAGIIDDALALGVTPRTSSFNMAITTAAEAGEAATALSLLRLMRTGGARPNLLTYNGVLSALKAAGRWQQAQRVLRDMARSRVRPTLISYNLALGACAKGKGRGGDAAMDILLEVQRKRMRPDVVTYSSVIAALSKGGDWQRVMGLLGAMEESELAPNSFSFSAAITACERAGEWEKALALFEGLHAAGGAVDASVYHAAILAASSAGVDRARSLMQQMEEAGIPPDVRAYNAVLRACERSADWDTAIDLLGQMKAAGVAPEAISYTSAVGALGRAREWEKALGLWTTMGVEGVAIDDLALATLLRALEGGGQWQIALDVFEAVLSSPDAGGVCTSTVFSAVLAACAAGAQADTALGYVSRMRSMGVVPSAACYHQVCAAHAAQQDWRGALAVWQDMVRQDMRPSLETYAMVYEGCLTAGAEEEASAIAEFAEREGVPLLALSEGSNAGGKGG